MAIKIDHVATGKAGIARTPKHFAFLNAVQEALDPILLGKEGWEDGWQYFTGQRISKLTGWPDEVTEELLVEIKEHYEQYDRDWIGNIQIIPGKGLSSPILAFRNPNYGKDSLRVDQLGVGEGGKASSQSADLDDES